MLNLKTIVYKINGSASDLLRLSEAGSILKDGGLVAFPTETVYGLGASALSESAAEKIYAAKGRPSDNPLIVHVADPAEAEDIAYTCELYYKLAERFMPGPLTVILPKRDVIPEAVTGGLDTVAVRCPVNGTARELIRLAGVPVAAPSANRSGSPSPTMAEHVIADLDGRVDMIIDGGSSEIGIESTVISIADGIITILRPGAVTEDMLKQITPSVYVDKAVTDIGSVGDKPASPGMKYKHYAPKANVILVYASDEDFYDYVNAKAGERDGVFASSAEADRFNCSVLLTGEEGTAAELNHSLYALLRDADLQQLKNVFIRKPPSWGEHLALYNRLIRAAAGKIVHINRVDGGKLVETIDGKSMTF